MVYQRTSEGDRGLPTIMPGWPTYTGGLGRLGCAVTLPVQLRDPHPMCPPVTMSRRHVTSQNLAGLVSGLGQTDEERSAGGGSPVVSSGGICWTHQAEGPDADASLTAREETLFPGRRAEALCVHVRAPGQTGGGRARGPRRAQVALLPGWITPFPYPQLHDPGGASGSPGYVVT